MTDLPLESVTVTWNMYEALDHVVVSNEKVTPVSEVSLSLRVQQLFVR